MNKNIIFVPSGRFGNAVFRYMACSLINIIHPELNHKYTLNAEYNPLASFFDFYKGSDCEQNDTFFININNETIISELLNRYKYNNSIMGFNTLGYVKHTIDTSKLISNQYINESNGHGIYVKNTICITDDNYMNVIYDINKIKNVNLLIDGYFQFSYIYLQYKPQILEYMDKHKHEHKIQTDRNDIFFIKDVINDIELDKDKIYDIAFHIRLGDFNGRLDFIEPQYYIKLFETIDIKSSQKICLVHEPITNLRDSQYIQELIAWFKSKNININIECNSLLVDFNIMKQATILVCSMSTLSWIAAYVSNHIKKCYMPNYNFYNKFDPSNSLDRSNVYFNYPIENTVLYDISSVHPIISKIKTQLLTLPQYSYRLNKLNNLFENLTKIGIKPNIFNGVYGKDILFDQNGKNDNTQLESITWNNTTYNYNKKMKSYRDVSIPAAARAMNLVRRHLSMPMESETFKNAASIEGESTARNLRREAKANHLRAKRRKMLFADIPEGELPVLLQLSGGSNFVILKEKGRGGECLVQFPDSREAVVDGERLDEVYDGICVFLQPRSSRNNSDLSGLTFPLAGKVFVAGG